MPISEDNLGAFELLTRLGFVRDDLTGIDEKFGEQLLKDESGTDLKLMIEDVMERVLEIQRELVIVNPNIREYVDDKLR